MRTVILSGAGSGISLEFLRYYAANLSDTTLYALDVAWPEDLPSCKHDSSRIVKHTIDASDPGSVDEFAAKLGNETVVDLFIHGAGVRGLVKELANNKDDPKEAETLEVMDKKTMLSALTVNVVGSFLLIRALVPALKRKTGENKGGAGEGAGRCVVLGSRMGSITANNDGAGYAYRPSKAGLNALVQSFSIDVPEVVFTVLHPGRVQSRMTPVREEGAVDADEAVAEMIPLIDGLKKSDSGKFYLRSGETVPW